MDQISIIPLAGFPLVKRGDDLAWLILDTVERSGLEFLDGDVVAVAQKVVSKAEGAIVRLSEVVPGARALEVAAATGKDARLAEVILRESTEVLKLREQLVIVVHRLGFVCANAGVDRSNAEQEEDETVILLPRDPDRSARQMRDRLQEATGRSLAVMVTDTHGRAFREGVLGVALGLAGMPALVDLRGRTDLFGFKMQVTIQAVADQVAAAATLAMGETNEGRPVVIVRGLRLPPEEGSVRPLIRTREKDMFRPEPLFRTEGRGLRTE